MTGSDNRNRISSWRFSEEMPLHKAVNNTGVGFPAKRQTHMMPER